MALVDSVLQFANTSVGILRSRLELASIDVEDELQSMICVTLAGSAAVILTAFALLFAALAIVAIYWETRRVEALLAASGVFALVATSIAIYIRRFFKYKTPFMAATLAELNKDRQRMGASL